MTPREADRIIKSGKPTTVITRFKDTFTAVFTKRDRWCIETADGGKFERSDLDIVKDHA
jgi:hypothetical protein